METIKNKSFEIAGIILFLLISLCVYGNIREMRNDNYFKHMNNTELEKVVDNIDDNTAIWELKEMVDSSTCRYFYGKKIIDKLNDRLIIREGD